MKQKAGRKLLSFLLTLAMVVGLMPGMGLTAYAASPGSSSGGETVEGQTLEYPLWVGETQVTSENAADVFGDGKVSYNAETNTLTLNGYDNEGKGYIYNSAGGFAAGIYAIGIDLTINVAGDSTVTGPAVGYSFGVSVEGSYDDATHTLAGGNLTIGGDGTLTAAGGNANGNSYGIYSVKAVTINGKLIANGGQTSDSDGYSHGIVADNGVTVNDNAQLTATGNNYALDGYVKNYIPGTGWTDAAGTQGKTPIAVSESGRGLSSYKKVQFPAAHTHDLAYSADGAHIIATCSAEGCDLTDSKATLTIVKPTLTTYGGTGDAAATLTGLTDFNTATGKSIAETDIKYIGRDGTTYTESTTAPTNAGKYTAKITVEGKTANVDYEIAKVATTITTAPTAGAITYGQTLANSALTGGAGSVAGTFAWKDSTVAPAVADSQTTEYDVVFTPTDGNYSTAECKVKLTVNKADSAVTKAPEAKTLTYNGTAQALVTAGTAEGGTMYYAVTTEDKAPTDDNLYTTSIPTATDAGTYYVWYKVVGDVNYTDTEPKCVETVIAVCKLTYSDNGGDHELYFPTLQAAIDAAPANVACTITLLTDVTLG